MTNPINAGITVERLREVFRYDADTGVFIRLVGGKNARVGDVAGTVNARGYRQLRVDGRIFLEHRLAVLYVTGEWPRNQVDHIDGNRTNNRFNNLREATQSENSQNLRTAKSNNKAGLLGAHKDTRRNNWFSQIKDGKRNRYLGSYETALEAHKAYLIAKAELHKFNTLDKPDGDKYSPRIPTSIYRGVSWCSRSGKWLAYVKAGGKGHHLGYFVNEFDAHKAVNVFMFSNRNPVEPRRSDNSHTRRDSDRDEFNRGLCREEVRLATERGWL